MASYKAAPGDVCPSASVFWAAAKSTAVYCRLAVASASLFPFSVIVPAPISVAAAARKPFVTLMLPYTADCVEKLDRCRDAGGVIHFSC